MEHLTERTLEFDKIKAHLKQLALCPLGGDYIDALAASTDHAQIEAWLTEVTELKEIRGVHGHLPLGGLTDIRPALAQARVQGEIRAAA